MTKKQLLTIIEQAMKTLEDMPCSEIGRNGPTIGQLMQCDASGCAWGGDNVYHTTQMAWRILQTGIDEGQK